MTHAGNLLHHCFCYFFAFCFATLRGTTLLALGEDDLALSDLNQAAKLNNQKDLYTLVRFFFLARARGRTVGQRPNMWQTQSAAYVCLCVRQLYNTAC